MNYFKVFSLIVEFSKPSAIQQRTIIPIAKGRDVIAHSQAGTGKTCAFVIGLLQAIDTTSRNIQVIVLCPTRELARQNCYAIKQLGNYMNVQVISLVGGKFISEDLKRLEHGVHVISGTPGRVYDMIQRNKITVDHVKMLVFDEVDEMLSRGFKEQIYNIYHYFPPLTQIVCVSATMPYELLTMTKKFMTNPVEINVKRDEITLEGIRQFFVAVQKEEWKFDTICDIYDMIAVAKSIIYCNTRKKSQWLASKFTERNFTVVCLHGDMLQSERYQIINSFYSFGTNILITTDLCSIGIDISQISLFINYDMPVNKELFIQRTGRYSRFCRKAVSISFIKEEEIDILRAIEQFYSIQIDELPMNFDIYLDS